MNRKILAQYTSFAVIGKGIAKFSALNVLYVTRAAPFWWAQDGTYGQIRTGGRHWR